MYAKTISQGKTTQMSVFCVYLVNGYRKNTGQTKVVDHAIVYENCNNTFFSFSYEI